MVVLLIFWGTSTLFFIVVAPTYFPTKSAQEFPFFHILANTCCLFAPPPQGPLPALPPHGREQASFAPLLARFWHFSAQLPFIEREIYRAQTVLHQAGPSPGRRSWRTCVSSQAGLPGLINYSTCSQTRISGNQQTVIFFFFLITNSYLSISTPRAIFGTSFD